MLSKITNKHNKIISRYNSLHKALNEIANKNLKIIDVIGYKKIIAICPNSNKKYTYIIVREEEKNNIYKSTSNKYIGEIYDSWTMHTTDIKKYNDPAIKYIFINMERNTQNCRFFIVPSSIIAEYLPIHHNYWLTQSNSKSKIKMRKLYFGMKGKQYPIALPFIEDYEDKWI